MSLPLRLPFRILLLAAIPGVMSLSTKPATTLQAVSYLETSTTVAARQNAEVDTNILFYISDDDQDDRVAVNFQDAVNYAISSLEPPCEDDQDEFTVRMSSAFMTGDLYDNDITDVSKLNVKVATGSYSYVALDSDDYDDLLEDDDESEELPNLVIQAKERDTEPLTWDRERRRNRNLDLDDWQVWEVDTATGTQKDDDLPIPAQKVPSRELVYDLDEEAVFVAGEREVMKDLDDIPLLYSRDARSSMVGDLFDNDRTDQVLMRVMQRTMETQQEPQEEVTETPVDILEVTTFDIVVDETKDVDDLDEIDAVFEPKDIEIIPERDGGDLPLITAYDRADYMVGDLYNNERTDASKLSIYVLNATIERLTWEETAEPELPEKPEFEDPVDVDEIHNMYVAAESVDFDEQETLVVEVPVTIPDTVLSRLIYQSPSGYLTGDLFNNQRTDSSRLTVNELIGRPLTWGQMRDVDDLKTVYDLDSAPETECDQDDVDEIDLAPGMSDVIDSMNSSPETQAALLRSRRISGDRLEFYDMDDVPAFFSFDAEDYVAGDMFDNKRSDSFKLTVNVVTEGDGAVWEDSEDYDDSKNPGFLQ